MADLSKFPSLSSTTHKGDELALKIVADLMGPLFEGGLTWQESLARSALEEDPDKNILIKIDTNRRSIKKADKKNKDIFAKLNSYTLNQVKNHALRFGVEQAAQAAQAAPPRGSTWGFKGFVGSSNVESRDYEDVLAQDILSAPICDVCIVQYGEAIPDGYYRLLKTLSNKKANLNSGSGGNPIYLCIKKDLTGKLAPITNFIVIFPDRNEYVPPGYHVVQRGKAGCNINTGTGAERIYLCYKKDFLGNPIVDIQIILPSKTEDPPKSFNVIEKSTSGVQANLNLGNSGPPIFFCYRQELIRLSCLLNEGDPDAERRRSFFPDSLERKALLREDRGRSASPVPRGRGDGILKIPSTSDLNLPAKDEATSPAVAHLTAEDNHEIDSISAPSDKVGSPTTLEKASDLPTEDDWMEAAEESDVVREAEMSYLRRMQDVVDASGKLIDLKRRKALLAVLAAVYVRHGIISELAVAGLSKLLKDTDFFENDLSSLPLPGTITMLDLTIESVCDRFDLSAEGDHDTLLQFLKICIKHSAARLSPISLQRMFRAISYLCCCYSTRSTWLIKGLPMPLSEPGMDISPFKVLKELVWDTVAQVETVEIAHFLPDPDPPQYTALADLTNKSESYLEVRLIVEDLIDDAIDSVDVSRICEAAYQTISKQSTSTSSSSFWQLINNYSKKLFADYPNRNAYVTLCAICKQAWYGIRTSPTGDPIPRDLGSKLLALESISEFCQCAGEKMKMSKVVGYQIRRIVVPCILYNISYAMVDHKIFAKVLSIITALWKKWRRHIRIEFAILCEQLVFKVLQASVVQIRPIFQMIAVQEVINWFDQPHMLIEMFVNYDIDRKFVSHWNTFSYLVRSMCAIGRRLSVETKAWDWKHGGAASQPDETHGVGVTIRDVHSQALEEVSRMAKTLMDASGHAFLIMQDSEFRNRSLGAGAGWVEDEDAASRDTSRGSGSPSTGRKVGSVRSSRAAHEESEGLIKEAIKISTEKGSLKKAVAFLLSKGFMPDTPQEIANFLRVYKNSFDAEAIGEFLGEGGTNPVEEDYWSQIRFRYTRAVSFVEMDIEPALRLYLTNCGFRLPGEAQKINRFVEVFVKAFWQDNSGTEYCPFKHPDTVHLLSYAIIMLNTDLHRANTDKKKNKKMSKEEFINNLRGADQGSDVDKDYLQRIYDNVANQPIELAVKTPTTSSHGHSTGLAAHKAEENKAEEKKDDIVNSVLSSNPKATAAEARIAEEKRFILDVCRSLRDSEDLLRSLASFSYRFQQTNIDMKISLDLVSFMFETVWFHFHAIVESIFNAENADMHAKFTALDILCYCLTSSIFLDLKMERMVFASLLKKFRASCESLPHVLSNPRHVPDDSWFLDIENVSADTALETIAKLHHLMVHIKDTIQESMNYELTRQVAAKFEKKAKILENNTFFVRQGDLSKVSRNGRATPYRFFLFSDHLIYAHMSMKKEYVVHASLALTAMSASDIDTDPSCCSFYVSHPVKSFVVVAESPVAKQHWLRDIRQTIVNCKKREHVANNTGGPVGRRMSMISRIESQQQTQLQEREASISYISPERNKARRASYRTVETESEEAIVPYQTVPFSAPCSPSKGAMNSSQDGQDSQGNGQRGQEAHNAQCLLTASELGGEEVEEEGEDDEVDDGERKDLGGWESDTLREEMERDDGEEYRKGHPVERKQRKKGSLAVMPKLAAANAVTSATVPTSELTPEERAKKQRAAIEKFKDVVTDLSSKPLNALFLAVSLPRYSEGTERRLLSVAQNGDSTLPLLCVCLCDLFFCSVTNVDLSVTLLHWHGESLALSVGIDVLERHGLCSWIGAP